MKTIPRKEFDALIERINKFFPDEIVWIQNIKNNPPVEVEQGKVLIHFAEYENPAIDMFPICGCGRSEDVQRLYWNALKAIDAYDKKTASLTLEQALAEWDKEHLGGLVATLNGEKVDKKLFTWFKFCDSEILEYVILYVLNDLHYTDHGSSVHSSTLTNKGKCALELLNLYFETIDKSHEEDSDI